jgi:hypothetical protein
MLDRFPIETSIEEGAASDANDADPNEAAVAPASIDTGFDATSVTATVNPLQAPAPATVETGFADLDGTPAPVQQAAPAVNTMADTGGRQNPDADLDARVAALLPNKSITNWNAVSAFMGAVVPWPGLPQDPGWIAVPNGYVAKQLPGGRDPKTGKYPIGPGKAFKTVDTLISYAGWANTTDFIKDLFFCLSMQREVTIKKNSKGADIIQAKRTAAGAIAVKAIWLDVDVGKENAYADLKEALGAAIMFREAVGLPPFSAIVGSGGGIHLYWISDRALTPDEWSPYAEGLKALAAQHGLKCDLGVTTDIARVLRVPGSFNHKEGTPRPCQLFNVPLKQYDFNTALGFLRQITPIGQVKAPLQLPTASMQTARMRRRSAYLIRSSLVSPANYRTGSASTRMSSSIRDLSSRSAVFIEVLYAMAVLTMTTRSGCTPSSARHSWRTAMTLHTKYRPDTVRIPRLIRRRCSIARWLNEQMAEWGDTPNAPLLQALAAKRARRAPSSGK